MQYSSIQNNDAKLAAIPNDNSLGNWVTSYFQQVQQEILTDFNQDANLFCEVVTTAPRVM